MMDAFRKITSKTAVLPVDNVDTDQIIPARFLTITTKEGLGESVFADWRNDPEFVLNRPEAEGARILVAGENFGCGSSREHAPWALVDYGFRAVVSTSIADIFKNNAVKNGLVPVEVEGEVHRFLLDHPGASVTVDLETCELVLPDGSRAGFPLDGFARHCLLNGIDQLDYLLQQEEAIARFESSST
jgi:3-isopropylmalate/(R)-2-methylmalate dehydratase small subunit